MLGAITPGILAVWVDAQGNEIKLSAFAEDKLSEDDRAEIEAAGTEISADFPGLLSLDVKIIENLKLPISQPDSGWWVFVRHGCSIALTPEQQKKLLRKGTLRANSGIQ